MHLKDHYLILELEPFATQAEIKKAYRRLALQYHPDKNPQDPYAATQFAAIKEAYEVLTNPSKKELYLQQRWYDQSIGKRKKQAVLTPVTVLKQAMELEKYVSKLDVFRMDKEGLQQYILELISDDSIEKLLSFGETETNRQIIAVLIKSMKPLPLSYTSSIIAQLYKLGGADDIASQQLASFVQQTAKKNKREKYSLIVIILVTAILCLLIWLVGR